MYRPLEEIEPLAEALSRFVQQPHVLALSPEGTWHGKGAWTLAEALRIWSSDTICIVAIASAIRPVLHVATRLPGLWHYLDADGLSTHDELLLRYRQDQPRDNPFFVPYDPNFFLFNKIPLWPVVARNLSVMLTQEFGDGKDLL